jgi:uncharacterized protein Yka (UPF0111/DUF47 family)
MDAVDAAQALHTAMAELPLHALTDAHLHALIAEMERVEGHAREMQRRLIGQLISQGAPTRLGGTSWAEVLARRLRISPAEAQRRIATAVYSAPHSTAV